MQDFRQLRVWQRSEDFAARVHDVTSDPGASVIGPWRGQLRRASSSIGANIAEGAMRDSPKQFAHFLSIAIASASESESHVDLAWRIRAIPDDVASSLLGEIVNISRMLVSLRQRVQAAG
jgi:four helix bundle protein